MGNRRCLILYLMEYFEDNKGEKVTPKEITMYLDPLGISIARKALYQEIDALRDYGMIMTEKEAGTRRIYSWAGGRPNE